MTEPESELTALIRETGLSVRQLVARAQERGNRVGRTTFRDAITAPTISPDKIRDFAGILGTTPSVVALAMLSDRGIPPCARPSIERDPNLSDRTRKVLLAVLDVMEEGGVSAQAEASAYTQQFAVPDAEYLEPQGLRLSERPIGDTGP